MTRTRITLPLIALVLAVAACGKKAPEAPMPQAADPSTPTARPTSTPTQGTDEEAARRAAAERRIQEALSRVVYFEYDQWTLRADAQQTLTTLASVLREYPDLRLRIEGHADERGSLEYNVALGMRRALAVKEFLADLGLPATQFEVFSFGEERPMASGSGESAWSQNRRGEFNRVGGR